MVRLPRPELPGKEERPVLRALGSEQKERALEREPVIIVLIDGEPDRSFGRDNRVDEAGARLKELLEELPIRADRRSSPEVKTDFPERLTDLSSFSIREKKV